MARYTEYNAIFRKASFFKNIKTGISTFLDSVKYLGTFRDY